MESYQSIGIIFGIIGIIFGLLFSITPTGDIVQQPLGLWVLIISIAGICVVLADTRHSRRVSMVLIFLGAFGNVLLIIPGIMAYRYKPKNGGIQINAQRPRTGVKCPNCGNETGTENLSCPNCGSKLREISDREKQDREIEETRKKLEDLEREKERRDLAKRIELINWVLENLNHSDGRGMTYRFLK